VVSFLLMGAPRVFKQQRAALVGNLSAHPLISTLHCRLVCRNLLHRGIGRLHCMHSEHERADPISKYVPVLQRFPGTPTSSSISPSWPTNRCVPATTTARQNWPPWQAIPRPYGKCHFNASGIPCFSAVLLSRAHLHMAQHMDTSCRASCCYEQITNSSSMIALNNITRQAGAQEYRLKPTPQAPLDSTADMPQR
jgi:hypothetical protein